MPSDYARAATSEDAPPIAPNVATAYPPSQMRASPVSKILSVTTIFGALMVLLVHYLDHPATRSLKSAFGDALSSAKKKGNSAASHLPTSKRLAVCYSGDVGTLHDVADQNLEVIRAADPSAAVFFYLNLHDDYYHERSGKHYTTTHNLAALQPVFDLARATEVKTFTPAEIPVPPESECHKKKAQSREHYSHNYLEFYAAAKCYEMIKTAEESAGERFGRILRLQPNMRIHLQLPGEDVKPRIHMSGSAMALMPRHMADAYFSVVDAFSAGRCTPLDDMGGEPCKNYAYDSDSVECLIIKWLKKADIAPSNGVYVNRRIEYPDNDGDS